MAIMLASLHDALRTAGAGDDAARRAAEGAAGDENRFAKIETGIGILERMAGFNPVLTAAVSAKPPV